MIQNIPEVKLGLIAVSRGCFPMALAERLRIVVMDEKIDGEEYLPGQHLTISLGVSVSSADDETYNDLVTRADSALYRAKYLRKNRVESYHNFFDRFENIESETKDALMSIRGLVSIINILDPEVIVLGGGVSMAGEFLLDAVREAMKPYVFYKTMPYARVELAQLGADAGIIGAALLGKE